MQQELQIQGGQPLQGTVKINGAKNSALPLLVATLLTDQEVILHNVPSLADISTMLDMISSLGKEVSQSDSHTYHVQGAAENAVAPANLVTQMRASFLVLAPLLSRLGRGQVALPGGCTIGSRPVDLHLKGLHALGATIEQRDGSIRVEGGQLEGTEVYLDYPSVGTTEQIMMAAVQADGKTMIYNPAREPEILDLANFLGKLGADIQVHRYSIEIDGKTTFQGATHSVIPDRIEAGTYLIIGAITPGEVCLKSVNPSHVKSLSLKLEEAGVEIDEHDASLEIRGGPSNLNSIDLTTLPYPGFPTDLQAPVTALLSLADGESVIQETVFDSRVDHVPELKKLGADITVEGSTTLLVNGVENLQGADVVAADIRAGASLITAGLAAKGTTVIHQLHHVDRGYSDFVPKLRNLGAAIKRVTKS